MRIAIALGGNALLHRGERPDAELQRERVAQTARALAPLATEHELVICHGNGPQVGVLALESESDPALSHPFPLDVLVAQTQGMIGYWLVQELHNAGVERPVVAIVTQTVVRMDDPAFAHPTKPIGTVYTEREAAELRSTHGWTVRPDGDGWRRVVPSPAPVAIVEAQVIDTLLQNGTIVVCGGGGGVPVASSRSRGLRGVDAVVDKDFTAARIAIDANADQFVVVTDVPGVVRDYGTAAAQTIDVLADDDPFVHQLPAGSMRPKVEACGMFAAETGRPAAIGALTAIAAVVAGDAGTRIVSAARSAR